MNLKSLSILYIVVMMYSGLENGNYQDEFEALRKMCDNLYHTDSMPFILDKNHDIPMHLFSPRLRNLLDSDEFEARKLWDFISARENVIRMLTATEMENPAAEALSYRFEEFYTGKPEENGSIIQFKQIIGYMIKIIMELNGYVVAQRRVKINPHPSPKSITEHRFFATASRYRKLNEKDLKAILKNISDPKERRLFTVIFKLVTTGQTQYQKTYALDNLASWDVLVKSKQGK